MRWERIAEPGRYLADLYCQAHRGHTSLEKKAAWPFDYYQASQFYPVEYHYYWRPNKTSTGNSQLTMMHALAVVEGLSIWLVTMIYPISSQMAAYSLLIRHNIVIRWGKLMQKQWLHSQELPMINWLIYWYTPMFWIHWWNIYIYMFTVPFVMLKSMINLTT